MARTSLFRQPASPPASQPARQPASPPASQPARIRQSNNQQPKNVQELSIIKISNPLPLKWIEGPGYLTALKKNAYTRQPKRNKRISRSAAARRNESMPRQSLKLRQYAAASMPRSAT
ncbi:hypothetical protein DPMN_109048 [Dreissena polymorpha]|uniref:Uncharacterized protein n=1 Tax=Dreissena polymorpha TaxID=45954 RepID=A0A9D4KA12_DREPO|nr:hypothetical protein DPMN_109048 [Dreissena polymorpha]